MPGLLACLTILGGCADSTTTPTATAPTPAKTEASSKQTEKPAATPSKSEKSARININKAPIAELDKLELPGTKPSLSERIQGGRPYSNPEDMVKKKVISQEEFDLIKNLVTTEEK